MFFLKRECLTIIGTAHVSANSVEEVKNTIYEQHPEIVAIELDRGRYTRLKNEMMVRNFRKRDISHILP